VKMLILLFYNDISFVCIILEFYNLKIKSKYS
jgi:hypothetical protein